MATLLVLNGPNLNLLGTRQPEVYGSTTLTDIEDTCLHQAGSVGATLAFFQSNHEGDLIDQIHAAKGRFDGILINAGALSHTSIAIMDAISSVEVPTIDIHLSNIHAREEYRHTSFVSKVAIGSIVGFGPGSYLLAIDAMMMHLDNLASGSGSSLSDPLEISETQRVVEDPIDHGASALMPDDADAEVAVDMSPELAFEESQTPAATDDTAERPDYSAAAAAAIAAQARALENAGDDDEAPVPKNNPAFNEMFETPPKEVLDSLGIAAPELRQVPNAEPPTRRSEPATKAGLSKKFDAKARAQARSFRKFS